MFKGKLEVPIHVGVQDIIEYARNGNKLMAYGSFGCSPLNGGRGNTIIFNSSKKTQDAYRDLHNKESEKLLKDIKVLNKVGIPFYLTYSNLLCSEEELSCPETMGILDKLVDSNVKNGVIVTNTTLENHIKNSYQSNLEIISSCQKLYPGKHKLTADERLVKYDELLKTSDWVVLTHLDSNNFELINKIEPDLRKKLISMIVPHCIESCNSYWHYLEISLLNKIRSYIEQEEVITERKEKAVKKREPFYERCSGRQISFFTNQEIQSLMNLGIECFKIPRSDGENDFIDMFNLCE